MTAPPLLTEALASYYLTAVEIPQFALGREPMLAGLNRRTIAKVKEAFAHRDAGYINGFVLKPMQALWNEATRCGLLTTIPVGVTI